MELYLEGDRFRSCSSHPTHPSIVFASCDLLAPSFLPVACTLCLPLGVEVKGGGAVDSNPGSAAYWLNGCRQGACWLWASVVPSVKWVHLSTYFWKGCRED